jgi:hypothetical protein
VLGCAVPKHLQLQFDRKGRKLLALWFMPQLLCVGHSLELGARFGCQTFDVGLE